MGFARFRNEEEIGLKLCHPFLLKVHPAAEDRSRPYIVTEFLRGCTLAHLQHQRGPLPEADVLKISGLPQKFGVPPLPQYHTLNDVMNAELNEQLSPLVSAAICETTITSAACGNPVLSDADIVAQVSAISACSQIY